MSAADREPARPWAFGPMISADPVARQAECLVRRYDLLDALSIGSRPRQDIMNPDGVHPKLAAELFHQLVGYADFEPTGGERGYDIAPGVRTELLAYSPVLDRFRNADNGTVCGLRVFRMPTSEGEFAWQHLARAGVVGDLDQEYQNRFKLTPALVGRIAMDLAQASDEPGPILRLVCSREFDAACQLEPRLLGQDSRLVAAGFTGPVIGAFRRLSEVERIGGVVREVQGYAHISVRWLRRLLITANDPAFVAADPLGVPGVAYSRELAEAFAADPALVRLAEFLATSTDVLASWRNAVVADRGTFIDMFRPYAALHGEIGSDAVTALVWSVDVREAFLSALRRPRAVGIGSRQSVLANDAVLAFWSLTNPDNNLAAALLAGLPVRTGRPPAGAKPKQTSGDDGDDVRHSTARLVKALGRDGTPEPMTSMNHLRTGAALARLYLPAAPAPGVPTPGAASRGDENLWADRYREFPFWARYQDPDQAWIDGLDMAEASKIALRSALLDLRAIAGLLLPWAPSPLTARVMADLATGVTALSANPAWVRAVRKLARLNRLLERLAEEKQEEIGMSPLRRRLRQQLDAGGFRHVLGPRRIGGVKVFSDARFGRRH